MMELIKDRPIVFFDLEATGINIMNDRIVEISVVKIFPDGRREVKTRRINPEMHIPEEASAIHGIYDRDVANEPTFRAISKNFFIYLEDCDLGGYNITKFDIPMLTREFSRAGLTFTTANRRIIDSVIRQMKAPAEKFYMNLQHYGNTSAASIPLALADMQQQNLLRPGAKLLCVGFGGGFTWGASLVCWKEKE